MRILRMVLVICAGIFLAASPAFDIVSDGWGTKTVKASATDTKATGLSLKEVVTGLIQKDVSHGIRVDLSADKIAVQPGEPVTFTVQADKDCHLTLIHVGRQGKVDILWPNSASGWDDRVGAGQQITVPTEGQGVKFQFDGSSPDEIVAAIATDRSGIVLGDKDVTQLPGDEVKVLECNPNVLMQEIGQRITAAGPQVQWGGAEMVVKVGPEGVGQHASARDVKVTLQIYSGRRDPSWTLTPEQAATLADRLKGLKSIPVASSEPPETATIGYQGFTIEGLEAPGIDGKELHLMGKSVEAGEGHFLSVGQDMDLEKWLIDTAGRKLPSESKEFALSLLAKSRNPEPEGSAEVPQGGLLSMIPVEGEGELEVFPDVEPREMSIMPKETGLIAKGRRMFLKSPPYEPDRWNRPNYVKMNNNCYGYSTNRQTNTYPQPGEHCGRVLKTYTAAAVRRAVMCDGLIPIRWTPSQGGHPTPMITRAAALQEKDNVVYGHVVAVIIHQGVDYHWYRLDNTGRWSHKAGKSRAINKDSKGHLIVDPRTAAVPYHHWGGYYFVPSYVRVKGDDNLTGKGAQPAK